MENNLIGALAILRIMGMKPNFSELARAFQKDRHTVKGMYEGKERKERRKKPSELDRYADEIVEILSHPGTRVKSAYWYFKNEKRLGCGYDNFKAYVRKNGLAERAKSGTPHPLYETDPGQQLQVDWVEDIKLTTVDGGTLLFNLFSATLGYSRLHYFEYSEFKQEADFKRCLIHCFKHIGGLTKEVLTDNMSAVVSAGAGGKAIHPSIIQFFKDLGVELRLCKVRTPETKGKDETSNKYANWLMSYDGKVKDVGHLIKLIGALSDDANRQRNTRTNVPPALLFQKEKEYLAPLPSAALLGSLEGGMRSCKVPSTFLIDYKGAKYSVPPYLITKTVGYEERGGKLLIYHRGDLVAEHALSGPGLVNYQSEHYKKGLAGRVGGGTAIDELAERNLARFKDLGDERDV